MVNTTSGVTQIIYYCVLYVFLRSTPFKIFNIIITFRAVFVVDVR